MTTNIDHLLSFCPTTSRSPETPVSLPEPCLPPRTRGGRPIPLSEALAAKATPAAKIAQAKAQTSNGYPFMTKRQILARLEAERDFRHEALLVLFQRQTEDEVATRDTKWKNKRGFMSSHAVHGTRIAELLLAGEILSEEDEDKLAAMVVRYTKQLAAHYRQVRLAEQPELAAQAAKFGIGAL
jgi:hypothetical protein